ncbi:minor capsid protein [Streptomyces phage ShakeNBake]|nr:minor capsid protein [Streptomyces phage PHTowN]QNO12829.1 minor capsid protein [Streptomyces phage ShakeNBake]
MAERIDPEALLELVQQKQIEAISKIEDKAIKAATEKRYAAIDDALRTATSDWVKTFGSMSAPGEGAPLNEMIRSALSASNGALKGLEGSVISALSEAVGSAVTAATEQGAAFVEGASGKAAAKRVDAPTPDLKAERAAVKAAVSEGESAFKRLLRRPVIERLGLRGILAGLRQARNVLGRAKSTITSSVNENVTKTMQATATANKAKYEVWVAERDACVNCLAYAGRIVKKGEDFPGGLSWDPKQRDSKAKGVRPPLHPHCRCRPVPWDPAWARDGEVSLPEAVSREAQRSIARGFSLPSESNASRIRALKELLKGNPDLPKTVLERARRDLKKGEFARGRSVPTSNP